MIMVFLVLMVCISGNFLLYAATSMFAITMVLPFFYELEDVIYEVAGRNQRSLGGEMRAMRKAE